MEQGKKLQRRLLLHEEVSQYIKETILTGELKPGDRIVESRLAQELGVSQAPVREALRELEFSGLVEQKPFSGTYVKQVTVKEIRQFYEVRAALERLGAECAAQRMNKVHGIMICPSTSNVMPASMTRLWRQPATIC